MTDFFGGTAEVDFLSPGDSWCAHARLRSAALVSHLLTAGEWQEARFEEPRCGVLILTTTDEDDVRTALNKLAQACVEYLQGRGRIERKRGLVGLRTHLVLQTNEEEWRIGRRSPVVP